LNNNFYENFDINFDKALELMNKNFSHAELIYFLKNGNTIEKQFAALNIANINTQEDANALILNLIGCDGKIREASAYKINTLLTTYPNLKRFFLQPDIFAKASIDINGNICRLVIDSTKLLIDDNNFASIYLEYICKFIYESFEELDKFIYKNKKYVINKQLFKLYWSLEALKLFATNLPYKILNPILERAVLEEEYTIREKVAQILILTNKEEYLNLKEKIQNDNNYYVKNVFLN